MASSRRRSLSARVIKRVLDVAWYVVLVGTVAAIGVIIAATALGARTSVNFPVEFAVHGTYGVAGSGQHASVVQASGQLRIRPSSELVAVGLAFIVAALGFVFVVLGQLRALMREALDGFPFGPRSARRVRLVGVAILAIEVVRAGVVLAGSTWARSHVSGAGLTFRAAFPLNPAVVGLGILVVLLAEVFRIGATLQTDHDLTI